MAKTIAALAILVLALASCGGAALKGDSGPDVSTTTTPGVSPIPHSRPGINDAYDGDDTADRHLEENDDQEVEGYGQPANAAVTRAAVAFVNAYYADAAREDGAAACMLLTPSLADGLSENYDRKAIPAYMRGNSCREVMTGLFSHSRPLFAAKRAGLEVTGVRVTSRTVFVLLAFRGLRERRMMGLERFGENLKLEALLDSPYP